MGNRIDERFAKLRAKGKAAFMPFLTAGDPNYEATEALILECDKRGADLIELGIPFSDPIADGPTIQASFTRALNAGATVHRSFDLVRRLRQSCEIPILSMVSYTIVFKRGAADFIKAAQEAGIDGAIIPDLPIEEGAPIAEMAEAKDFKLAFLVAPTTPMARRKKIVEMATGFIYCVSVTGITGARDHLPDDLVDNVESIKSLTDKPVAVGFGVSTGEMARLVAGHADGVIVGSAIVKRAQENRDLPPRELAEKVGEFIDGLVEGTKTVEKAQT
ncbi:MAG: tryptophan synthase subunit alpha [Planctomycetes bacterium]|nr:tryptophan synthase subunit alpha [Planctomycetota bacterium]